MMKVFREFMGRLKIWAGVALLLPLLCVNTVLAYSNSDPRVSISKPGADGNVIRGAVAEVTRSLSAEGYNPSDPFLEIDWTGRGEDAMTIYLNKQWYLALDQNSKEKVMTVALSGIYNSRISVTNKNKIYNFISGEDSATSSLVRLLSDDVQTDFMSAYALLRPFSGGASTLLGILALITFLFMGFMIVLDCFYIGNSIFQWILTSKSDEKPPLISREAYKAVKASEDASNQSYVNPFGVYARQKIGQIIAMSILLLYLISGRIFDLIARIMDYFNGLM